VRIKRRSSEGTGGTVGVTRKYSVHERGEPKKRFFACRKEKTDEKENEGKIREKLRRVLRERGSELGNDRGAFWPASMGIKTGQQLHELGRKPVTHNEPATGKKTWAKGPYEDARMARRRSKKRRKNRKGTNEG